MFVLTYEYVGIYAEALRWADLPSKESYRKSGNKILKGKMEGLLPYWFVLPKRKNKVPN
jgi:hypothetical protein